MQAIGQDIQYVLQKTHVVALVELICNILIGVDILHKELIRRIIPKFTLKIRISASSPDSNIAGSSCLIAQTIQSITVLNCSGGILNNAKYKLYYAKVID